MIGQNGPRWITVERNAYLVEGGLTAIGGLTTISTTTISAVMDGRILFVCGKEVGVKETREELERLLCVHGPKKKQEPRSALRPGGGYQPTGPDPGGRLPKGWPPTGRRGGR